MYFLKKEDLESIKNESKDFDEFFTAFRKLYKEGKVVEVSIRKTNICQVIGKELLENGYEQVHYDIG